MMAETERTKLINILSRGKKSHQSGQAHTQGDREKERERHRAFSMELSYLFKSTRTANHSNLIFATSINYVQVLFKCSNTDCNSHGTVCFVPNKRLLCRRSVLTVQVIERRAADQFRIIFELCTYCVNVICIQFVWISVNEESRWSHWSCQHTLNFPKRIFSSDPFRFFISKVLSC